MLLLLSTLAFRCCSSALQHSSPTLDWHSHEADARASTFWTIKVIIFLSLITSQKDGNDGNDETKGRGLSGWLNTRALHLDAISRCHWWLMLFIICKKPFTHCSSSFTRHMCTSRASSSLLRCQFTCNLIVACPTPTDSWPRRPSIGATILMSTFIASSNQCTSNEREHGCLLNKVSASFSHVPRASISISRDSVRGRDTLFDWLLILATAAAANYWSTTATCILLYMT